MNRFTIPLVAAALMATASMAVAGPCPAPIAPLLWAAAWWMPGLAVAPRATSARDPLTHLVALGTGPILFGAGFCAGRLIGLPPSISALLAIWAGGIVVCARWWRGNPAPPGFPSGNSSFSWIPVGIAAGILVLAAWPALAQEAMRLRDDARLHLPVTGEMLRGAFPPRNPFLAGEPLAYFWFYHVILAATSSLVRVPLEFIPVGLSLHALVVLTATVDWTGRRLGLSRAVRGFALGALAFGLSPQGWMRLAWFHLTRSDINWALFDVGGSSTLFPVLGQGDPRLAAFLTKFAVTNALPLGLACFLLALLPLGRGPGGALRTGILIAGALAVHLVTGILLIAGLVFREVLVLAGMRAPDWRTARGVDRTLLAALGIALLFTLPYVAAILEARSGGGAATLAWQPRHALGLMGSLAGIALLAVPVLPGWIRGPETRYLLAAGLPALALPFAVRLVDGNEYKSVFVLLPLLVLPAGAGALRWIRGRALLLPLLILPFLPNAWLTANTYARERPTRLLLGAEREALRELGRGLPGDAVIWKADEGIGYSVLTLDLGRSAYLSDPYALQILGQWEGKEAGLRRAELAAAQHGRALEALGLAAKKMAPRPVWVVASTSDASRFPWLLPQLAEAGYTATGSAAGVTLFQPPPGAKEP